MHSQFWRTIVGPVLALSTGAWAQQANPCAGLMKFQASNVEISKAAPIAAGDIGGSPAPIWLHCKYRSVDFVNQEGATLYPAERYMDDISDPACREHLIRFADELTRHYAHNPALAAIGSELAGANWQRRREIIRTLVQRIDIATEVIKIIFRVTQNARDSDSNSIAITLSRT